MKSLISSCLMLFFFSVPAISQHNSLEKKYKNAVSFLRENLENKKVFNLFTQANWFPDSTGVWYFHFESGKKRYTKISTPDLIKSDLFDHEKLAIALTDSLNEEFSAFDLPISDIQFPKPGIYQITVKGKVLDLDLASYTLVKAKREVRSNDLEEKSPDDEWIAFTEDYNLYIRSPISDEIRQLSFSGKKNYEYATWYGWADIMEGENGERAKRFQVNWSPDSQWIHANVCDLRSANKMYLLDWSVDSLFRPKLLSYYRGSPGDTSMVYIEPVFFDIKTRREIRPNLPRSTHINQISVRWLDAPGKVLLERQNRGYQNLELYIFDLNTEELQSIYTESSSTNIDNFTYRLNSSKDKMFFLSEKSGWRQLYSLDLKTYQENSLTNGNYYINRIDRIDDSSQCVYFSASGKNNELNPYHQQLYSISFTGKSLRLLTEEKRHHMIHFSPDGQYFVDNYSTANIETTTVLRNSIDGKILTQLATADISRLDNWNAPDIFTAIAKDDKTIIYGALWKPTNFDSTKKYPIIDNSYTGPHTQVFPKDFRQAFANQALAELGFVVMRVDGLGSSGRSREFHNYSYKNLGGNLHDHVRAIRQLGKMHLWIDTTKVGIYGHSAGGYDAGHAMLAYPDFYKVAVASSADHDHRMEKAWWPEMYMGWPVDSVYHLQSNISMAANLKGKLLITHGGIDENVNPSATFKLAEALIQADKQFDMKIFPSQRHGYRGKTNKYFTKLRWNYFIEHLLGESPIWDIDWN